MLEINGKFSDGLGFMLGNQLPRELGWCGNQIVDGDTSYVRLWRVPESIVLDCRLPSDRMMCRLSFAGLVGARGWLILHRESKG